MRDKGLVATAPRLYEQTLGAGPRRVHSKMCIRDSHAVVGILTNEGLEGCSWRPNLLNPIRRLKEILTYGLSLIHI